MKVKPIRTSLLAIALLSVVFCIFAELTFYLMITVNFFAISLLFIAISCVIILIYSCMIYFYFRHKYWYLSLITIVLSPIIYVLKLMSFGGSTPVAEDDYLVGLVLIINLCLNEIYLIIGVVLGLSFVLINKSKFIKIKE